MDDLVNQLADARIEIERLKKFGDRLAHELMYKEHFHVLDAWWKSRGGHEECSACKCDRSK
jgi:hypothetical protein